MKIAITGASGYIGQTLIGELKRNSHEIIVVERQILYQVPELTQKISGVEIVIHLAGAPILKRWTKAARTQIRNSRIQTTRNLTKAINQLPGPERPKLFISASAIGIYAANGHHTEKSNDFAKDFVGQVVQGWEKSSEDMDESVRRVVFRIALVLGNKAKTIRLLLPVFRLGLGGKIGSGKQPFPFIHIQDVTRAILWAIEHPEVQGIYNLAAPQQVTNLDFTRTLSGLLKRPALFTVPAFAMILIYGKASQLILKNPSIYPERLTESGFTFSFPDIRSCLSASIKKPH